MNVNTTKPVAHTPTPWAISQERGSYFIKRPNYRLVAGLYDPDKSPLWAIEQAANAAFIVRAVNSHAALVDALSNLLAATAANYLPGIPELEDAQHHAQNALALAKEQS